MSSVRNRIPRSHVDIDGAACLELHGRIKSTAEGAGSLQTLLGSDSRLEWAKSAAHPGGESVFALGEYEIDPDTGRAAAPPAMVRLSSSEYDTFALLKVVGRMNDEHFFAPSTFGSPEGAERRFDARLYGFDRIEPQRQNGDWVYSLPLENLEVGRSQYRMVISLIREEAGWRFYVTKVTVTRGKEHCRVRTEFVARSQARESVGLLLGYYERNPDNDGVWKRLPLREFVSHCEQVAGKRLT
jgi:hypothetical protein